MTTKTYKIFLGTNGHQQKAVCTDKTDPRHFAGEKLVFSGYEIEASSAKEAELKYYERDD
jgi:hypothetical protein